ncbi:diacylglycerol kinase family lipid kinase [Shimazuella sp. AN120528]|uniref:diacylglycerol/lipid kinase family protein n=1 Tax=Shimazuella soli TaxID=1892854 RepID=UPI001F0F604C|nr:diacylglycerol kinase family protein [Shimazuella soli]MCH5583680.1 diacylglycerol kinase family lipid kinase [Shimazuella soli]
MYLFIVNPHAGRGKGLATWKQVELLLQQTKVEHQVLFTRHKGEAIELAKNASLKGIWTAVVAVGGDGTVHEVANGLYGTDIPLGYIPAGTGNDFAREWHIPFDPLLAWNRIVQHEVKKTDVLMEKDRVMLCYISAGFDGYVSRRVDASSWKKLLGKASYFVGALLSLRRFKPFTLKLRLDETDYDFEDVWLVTLSNGKSLGGGMRITPHANAEDGQMDICIVHKLKKLSFLKIFPKVYTGKHVGHSAVTFLRGKQAVVRTTPNMWAFADGEEIGDHPLDVSIISQGLFLL